MSSTQLIDKKYSTMESIEGISFFFNSDAFLGVLSVNIQSIYQFVKGFSNQLSKQRRSNRDALREQTDEIEGVLEIGNLQSFQEVLNSKVDQTSRLLLLRTTKLLKESISIYVDTSNFIDAREELEQLLVNSNAFGRIHACLQQLCFIMESCPTSIKTPSMLKDFDRALYYVDKADKIIRESGANIEGWDTGLFKLHRQGVWTAELRQTAQTDTPSADVLILKTALLKKELEIIEVKKTIESLNTRIETLLESNKIYEEHQEPLAKEETLDPLMRKYLKSICRSIDFETSLLGVKTACDVVHDKDSLKWGILITNLTPNGGNLDEISKVVNNGHYQSLSRKGLILIVK